VGADLRRAKMTFEDVTPRVAGKSFENKLNPAQNITSSGVNPKVYPSIKDCKG